MTANLRLGEGDGAGLVRAAIDRDVDLLVVQELTPEALARMERAGLADAYPYRAGEPAGGALRTMVFAPAPLIRVSRLPTVTASWAVDYQGLRVHAVHPAYPLDPQAWRTELGALVDVARVERPDLLLGDFNATLDHEPMRTLLGLGYRDAAEQAGAGWQPTWPANGLFRELPPAVAIDHVLVGQRLHARRTETVQVDDTDHLALLAELVVGPTAGRGVTAP